MVLTSVTRRELGAVAALTSTLVFGCALLWLQPSPSPLRVVQSARLLAAVRQMEAPAAQSVCINTATVEELVSLPGIGPKKAHAIVDDRMKRGRFASIEALDRVKGIGPATVERLRPYVTVQEKANP